MNITKMDILIVQMAWAKSLSAAAMRLCCSSYSRGRSMEHWWRLACKGKQVVRETRPNVTLPIRSPMWTTMG